MKGEALQAFRHECEELSAMIAFFAIPCYVIDRGLPVMYRYLQHLMQCDLFQCDAGQSN